jgi:hypothetical protein
LNKELTMSIRLLGQAQPETIPAGKRSVRANVWGNVNAYVGGRFWATLGQQYAVGTDEAVAEFLNGGR